MSNLFILFDAARSGEKTDEANEVNKISQSLFDGKRKHLCEVGPILFEGIGQVEFESWFMANCWGYAFGVLLYSGESFGDILKHFRKFLLVKTEDGQELYFRFYDPRVLKIFLPTCDDKQLIEFFGPVQKFIVEGDTKDEAIEFSHRNGILKQERINMDEVLCSNQP